MVRNRKELSAMVRNCHQLSGRLSSRPFYVRAVWAEPQANFSQIQLASWRIVACDLQPSISRPSLPYWSETQPPINTGPTHNATFGVLDGWQRAAICRNCRAKTWGTHKTSTAAIVSPFGLTRAGPNQHPWSCRTGCRASMEKGGCQHR